MFGDHRTNSLQSRSCINVDDVKVRQRCREKRIVRYLHVALHGTIGGFVSTLKYLRRMANEDHPGIKQPHIKRHFGSYFKLVYYNLTASVGDRRNKVIFSVYLPQTHHDLEAEQVQVNHVHPLDVFPHGQLIGIHVVVLHQRSESTYSVQNAQILH